MFVSAEMLTVMIGFATLLLALAGGFGWMIQRSDAQLQKLGGEIVGLRTEFAGEIAGLRAELHHEIAGVRAELVEIKIAIARLEGPTPRLITAR